MSDSVSKISETISHRSLREICTSGSSLCDPSSSINNKKYGAVSLLGRNPNPRKSSVANGEKSSFFFFLKF
jgi:hypothetical protein